MESLFFSEKRLFFQERASLFDFDFETSKPNRLFYSRTIGLAEGRPVKIYGGARPRYIDGYKKLKDAIKPWSG